MNPYSVLNSNGGTSIYSSVRGKFSEYMNCSRSMITNTKDEMIPQHHLNDVDIEPYKEDNNQET